MREGESASRETRARRWGRVEGAGGGANVCSERLPMHESTIALTRQVEVLPPTAPTTTFWVKLEGAPPGHKTNIPK